MEGKHLVTLPSSVREEDFYAPFADWLKNEIEDVTKAISLGRNKFKDKWGTPDVIGLRESQRSDLIKGPTEDRVGGNQSRYSAARDRVRSGLRIQVI